MNSSPRVISWVLLGIIAVLVGLLVMAVLMPEPMGLRRIALGLAISAMALSAAGIAVFMRSYARRHKQLETQAELAFERQALSELKQAAPADQVSPAASPEEQVVVQVDAGSADSAGAPGVEALVAQLRLARIDARLERQIRINPPETGTGRGDPLSGAVLHLAPGKFALVMDRPPKPDDWRLVFPRYDYVFIPLGSGHWACAERLEGFVCDRMDITL